MGFRKTGRQAKHPLLFCLRFLFKLLKHKAVYASVLQHRFEELKYVYDKSTKENREQENKEKAVLATAPGEFSRHIAGDGPDPPA